MTEPTRYQTSPIELPLRLDGDPAPRADCNICAALAIQRRHARKSGDHSQVSDINVEITAHTHR